MPIRINRTPAGSSAESSPFVYVEDVQVPLPAADASNRQILDFAAIVSLAGREGGSPEGAEIANRAARAYLNEYRLTERRPET